ncbi:type I toxin-antitoxin system Fst family toxin [Listeria rustica]|uniref:Type I toxin-antitoxin system Fst family toxin n=1 Tax=Listeria rustica TaxID=2713503 RepID=A0A7W1T906_9LIST|nr:type I toxin-antitoxin system Fst family toxin [Listeria rustica]
MSIITTVLAPIVVGCVLAIFNHWLEVRSKEKKRK